MNNTTAVKDPVCGMDVEAATAADEPSTRERRISSVAPSAKRSSIIILSNTWPSRGNAQERPWLLRLTLWELCELPTPVFT
jgi:hypothetical protein